MPLREGRFPWSPVAVARRSPLPPSTHVVLPKRQHEFCVKFAADASLASGCQISLSCIFRALTQVLADRRGPLIVQFRLAAPLRRPKNGDKQAEELFDAKIDRTMAAGIIDSRKPQRRSPATSR
ncbi:MAG: hypothetical protein L0Z55_05635, partial [Planctomycetes bacterium]|nr:hypothetical protein [Planctomycetota bacterium]